MKRTLLLLGLGALVGCSLVLGLNEESNRPCLAGKCSDKYVCFKDVCVPASGSQCKVNSDCPSFRCSDGGCALPPCADKSRDFRETDIDCGGGFCPACSDGRGCAAAADCSSQVCGDGGTPDGGTDGGTCLSPSCTDGVANGTETDLDCGGDGGCPRCADGLSCNRGADCITGSCSGVCQPGTCNDTLLNAAETDVDCGGPCRKCVDGKSCLKGTDCVSQVCLAGTKKCAVPTCSDLAKNGAETDLDCGGGSCQGCADTRVCQSGTDCANGVCQNATCRPAHCANGTKDVDETDKDCGGPCKKCGLGDYCKSGGDCGSNHCDFGYCGP